MNPTGHLTRVAQPDDIEAIVATVTSAFFDDPLWGPAFPDRQNRAAQASAFWRLLVTSAQRYPWTFVSGNAESAAIWLPPGGIELTEAEANGFDGFLAGIVGREGADAILAIVDKFEHARPTEPHFYLSLFATHDDHRGKGLGMGLLRENLARIDALGGSAYLESSNPANNDRYASVGFAPRDQIVQASGHVITTMWRPAQ
ncbi:GNAT family N-acetyltransferase [Salinibacterium sp.]|uniref:GNAT family N-acetyltransferase n=2 Tax=Salinibacterium sp. TaxID=1915057 RepID=UPI00286BE02A|nr:GNAT family N-acetyltransferase [Salinibacterium sp.]